MFPMKMGMVGAALATGISPIVSMSICMIHYLSKNNSIVFTKRAPSGKKLISACNLGVVAFVGELSSGITTLVFNFILLELSGNVAVAAYGVIANFALVGTALFNGVSLGLQPVASSVHGKMDAWAETKIYKYALKIGECIAMIVVAIVLIFADQLIAIFNSENSSELAYYASGGLRIYFLGFLIAVINIVKAGFYSAIGKGLESSVIALSRGIFSISLVTVLLSKILGVTGVWLAFPVCEIVTWLISMIMSRVKQQVH